MSGQLKTESLIDLAKLICPIHLKNRNSMYQRKDLRRNQDRWHLELLVSLHFLTPYFLVEALCDYQRLRLQGTRLMSLLLKRQHFEKVEILCHL